MKGLELQRSVWLVIFVQKHHSLELLWYNVIPTHFGSRVWPRYQGCLSTVQLSDPLRHAQLDALVVLALLGRQDLPERRHLHLPLPGSNTLVQNEVKLVTMMVRTMVKLVGVQVQ